MEEILGRNTSTSGFNWNDLAHSNFLPWEDPLAAEGESPNDAEIVDLLDYALGTGRYAPQVEEPPAYTPPVDRDFLPVHDSNKKPRLYNHSKYFQLYPKELSHGQRDPEGWSYEELEVMGKRKHLSRGGLLEDLLDELRNIGSTRNQDKVESKREVLRFRYVLERSFPWSLWCEKEIKLILRKPYETNLDKMEAKFRKYGLTRTRAEIEGKMKSRDKAVQRGNWSYFHSRFTAELSYEIRELNAKYPGQYNKMEHILKHPGPNGRFDYIKEHIEKGIREYLQPVPWKKEEDDILKGRVVRFEGDWAKVKSPLYGRSKRSCVRRYEELMRNRWSKEDDTKFIDWVRNKMQQLHRNLEVRDMLHIFKGKSPIMCHLRYYYMLVDQDFTDFFPEDRLNNDRRQRMKKFPFSDSDSETDSDVDNDGRGGNKRRRIDRPRPSQYKRSGSSGAGPSQTGISGANPPFPRWDAYRQNQARGAVLPRAARSRLGASGAGPSRIPRRKPEPRRRPGHCPPVVPRPRQGGSSDQPYVLVPAPAPAPPPVGPSQGLQRFVDAQNKNVDGFSDALHQITNGWKTSHWIWYIFPQLDVAPTQTSPQSKMYAIKDADEALSYLQHRTLGPNLYRICERLLLLAFRDQDNRPIAELMDSDIDSQKLKSCVTLFEAVAPVGPFKQTCARIIEICFGGQRCDKTTNILASQTTH